MPKKLTHEEVKKMIKELSKGTYELLDYPVYSGSAKLIKVKHLECNTISDTKWNKIQHNFKREYITCDYCKIGKYNHHQVKKMIKELSSGTYELLDYPIYSGSGKPIKVKHLECNTISDTTLEKIQNNFKTGYITCDYCKIRQYNHHQVKEMIKEISSNTYELLDYPIYSGSGKPIKVIHLDCNTISDTTLENIQSNFKRGHITCNNCSSRSVGENTISDILKIKKIKFIKEKKIDKCKHIKLLRFDFYLKTLNILIEYDGRQHFKAIEYFGGKKELLNTQERDKIKNNYCRDNNILLLRIPHTEQNNIETILDNFLHSDNKHDFLINYYNDFKEFYNIDDIICTQLKKTS